MYRKNMMENLEAKEMARNGFFHRLAELPMSRVAFEQLSSLYEKAQQQKLLAVGIKAGENTLKLAGMVASPVFNKLPVDALDDMACKQLDRLEVAVPSIKKEPKEILEASEQLYYKAKSVPGNTIKAVKDAGTKSVSEVKSYAVETVNPTVERVNKVKSYGTEKVHSATDYSKEKIKSVKDTYESVRSGELVQNYYNSVKGGIVHKYEDIKGGINHQYDGMVSSVSGMKDGVVGGYGKAKLELYNYTSQTLEPTVSRFSVVKSYGTEKVQTGTSYVSSTYDGLKGVTTSVVDTVVNNRVVKSVRSSGFMQTVNNSVVGLIGYADSKVEEVLPLPKGCDEDISPASPETGTWTRTMILVTKLRGRIYAAGQQRMKPYTTQAEDMTQSIRNYQKQSKDYITTTYTSTTTYIHDKYKSGHDYISGTYNTVYERYNGAVTKSKGMYEGVTNNFAVTRDQAYNNYSTTKDHAVEVWNTSTAKVESVYGYILESWSFARDYTLSKFSQSRPIREEMETPVLSRVVAEE